MPDHKRNITKLSWLTIILYFRTTKQKANASITVLVKGIHSIPAHIGSGLIAIDDEALNQFAIAGADKKFVWAKATIKGDKVEVWSDDIGQPEYVRYAWADNPFGANLYNKERLPASPFRTDQ